MKGFKQRAGNKDAQERERKKMTGRKESRKTIKPKCSKF